MKGELGSKQFFVTPAHTCSYLPLRNARTMFLDPRETITSELYQDLADSGFRRSGGHLYKPNCASCKACIPVRVIAERFILKKHHKRVLKKNNDLEIRIEAAADSAKYYNLYSNYISERHVDGDMYPPTREQFRSFLFSQWSDTFFLSAYKKNKLMAVAVTDKQRSGISAMYSFFDPYEAKRSLGVYSILKQLEYCQALGLKYLYLGYWIKNSKKMAYKAQYRPIEIYSNNNWKTLD